MTFHYLVCPASSFCAKWVQRRVFRPFCSTFHYLKPTSTESVPHLLRERPGKQQSFLIHKSSEQLRVRIQPPTSPPSRQKSRVIFWSFHRLIPVQRGILTTWCVCGFFLSGNLPILICLARSPSDSHPTTTPPYPHLNAHQEAQQPQPHSTGWSTSLCLVTSAGSCSKAIQPLFLHPTAGLLASSVPEQRRIYMQPLPLHLLPAPAALVRFFGTGTLLNKGFLALHPPWCLHTGSSRGKTPQRDCWRQIKLAGWCWVGTNQPRGLELAPSRGWAMFLHHAHQHILYRLITVQIFLSCPQRAEPNVRNYQIIAFLRKEI